MTGCQKKNSSLKRQAIAINFSYPPFSADPRKCTDPVTITLNFMLYEGLTRLEPDGRVSYALAERVKISRDKKKYLFYLRPAMWSDGSSLTAYHFEASWKKALDPEYNCRASNLLYPILNAEKARKGECSLEEVGVKAMDDQTLLVTLEHPTPYFLELTSFCTYFPVPFHGDEVPHPNQAGQILSSGPFQITSWKNEDEIIVSKNPYYWNADNVQLDEIQISMISDEGTALNLFEKGKLDMAGGLTSTLPLDAISTLRERDTLRQRPIAGTTFCTFNVHKYPFNNVHIRRAFALAINRDKITQNLFQMFDDVATGPVPHVMKETVTTFFEDHQKELARQQLQIGLDELGITKEEFPKVTYNYFASELHRDLALALQGDWKKVLGVNVQIQALEFKSHLAKLASHDFLVAQMSWVAQFHDPMAFLERFDGKDTYRNYSGWENPHYSELLAASFYATHQGRRALLEEAEALLMEEMPLIPLYHFHAVYLKSPRLHGLSLSPIGDVQFHSAYLSD